MKFNQVTHVIFDMDGLILEIELIYQLILSNVVKKKCDDNISSEDDVDSDECDNEGMRLKVFGRREDENEKRLIHNFPLKLTQIEFVKKFNDIYNKELEKASKVRGAERLIRHLHENDIPIAVATSSSRDTMAIKARNHQNLFVLFNHIVCGGSDVEVKASKPAPDIFIVCNNKFPKYSEPNECLVFEDSPNGVKAALKAGMQVVMVPDPRITPDKELQPTQVVRSLEDFCPEDFGLPPFPNTK